MYCNAQSAVWVNGQCIEEFFMGVCVHQGSVLSPLLFIHVVEALSHEFRTGEPLYADDLVLITDTQEEYIAKLKARKAGMENKGLHINIKKTKFLVSHVGHDVLKKSGKYPSVVFCSSVDSNSIECLQCKLWVHKRCSGIIG